MRIVTAAEMQAMDRETIESIDIPGRVLMENAGRGATRCFLERIYEKNRGRVGVIAGRGNNGGDGFVMARYLAQRGIEVCVFLLSTQDRVQGDAAANLNLLNALNVPVIEMPDEQHLNDHRTQLHHVACWIDAIFGTGLNADVRGYYKTVIDFINAMQNPVFAVDIPSGLNADTGQPCGTAIRAAATTTFGFPKIGHVVHPGVEYCGQIDVIDIGIPSVVSDAAANMTTLTTGEHIQRLLPQRSPQSHKGHTGHTLIVAGATGKTGAAAMTATTALRIGAGLVTLAVPRPLNPILENQVIEAMTIPVADDGTGAFAADAFDIIQQTWQDKRCVALGPGVGTSGGTRELVQRIVKECPLPLVIDADGLNNLAADMSLLKQRSAPTILTPHPGEMARMTGLSTADIQADRMTAVRDLARRYKVVVALKGAATLISAPDGRVWINPTGNAGMASGGMGDVLTGAVAGLIAQGCTPEEATVAAVYLHGLAADLLAVDTPVGYLATEVMDTLPLAMDQVMNDPPESPIRGPLL